MATKEEQCPKCGSVNLHKYSHEGYIRARCRDCQRTANIGFHNNLVREDNMIMGAYGPVHAKTYRRVLVPAGTKVLEHERGGFRDPAKNYGREEE
jgi:transposase-like protein